MECAIYKIRDWSRVGPGEVFSCSPRRPWVLYLGEVHERRWVASCFQQLLREASRLGARFLGLEHFLYTEQGLLDSWSRGEAGWEDLAREYQGGFNLDAYRGLLEEARGLGLRVLGLFPPRSDASLVARRGLEALGEVSLPGPRRLIADAVSEEYRGYRDRLMSLFPRQGPMARLDPERLVLAQAFKDTVAGYLVSRAVEEYGPGVVVSGWAHVEFNGSIPSRARRFHPGHGFISVTSRESGIEHARRELEEWLPVTIASFIAVPHSH